MLESREDEAKRATWNWLLIAASFYCLSNKEKEFTRYWDRWNWSWNQHFQEGDMDLLLTWPEIFLALLLDCSATQMQTIKQFVLH